jgi:hypothetical protein
MPTKKVTKKKNTKKKVVKQKQKQSQVQKVIVNINKSSAKSSKPKASVKGSTSASSYSPQPIFQAESSPYPSYVRQAAAVAVAQPTPVGNTIGAEPTDRTYVHAKKRRAEVPLFSQPPESVKRPPANIFSSDNESANLFKPFKQEPIQQEPRVEHASTYEKEGSESFSQVNPLKEKRKYVKKKEGPRRNSADDLLNRYQAATGKPFEESNVKVKTLKEIVEGLEKYEQSKPAEEEIRRPTYFRVEDIEED